MDFATRPKLLKEDYDVTHVINFDSLIPVVVISKIKNKKVIYEILDTFEDSGNLPKIIRNFMIIVDKLIMRAVDYVILVDENQIIEFSGIPNNYQIIYDSPMDIININDKNSTKNEKFVIFYAGSLYSNRNLNIEIIFNAILKMDNVVLHIAGYGDLVDIICKWESIYPLKIRYLGQLPHSEVIYHTFTADIVLVLRDLSPPINKYICGSTMFNAMMCGTPMIVRNGSSTSTKVLAANCGLSIDVNLKSVSDSIRFIIDHREFAYQLGINGRIAYENQYNWDLMTNKLLKIYMYVLK